MSLWLAVSIVALAVGFAPTMAPAHTDGPGIARNGAEQEWSGKYEVTVSPGPRFAASITMANGACLPVLVDPNLYRASRSLRGKMVRIEGEALPLDRADVEVTSVRMRDRWLATGYCDRSGQAIYAHRIRVAQKRKR